MNPEPTSETKNSTPELSGRVFAKINEGHIRPRPRWHFVLENGFLWAVGGVAILVGAISIAGALFNVANAGWRYQAATHDSWISFILDTAPFAWLLLLLAFILIGYFNIRLTKRGYRYPFSILVIGVVLSSTTLGLGLYVFGLGEVFDDALGHVPFYRPESALQEDLWNRPTRGLLAGEVLEEQMDGSFDLREFDGTVWQINGDDLRGPDISLIEEGKLVRVVGVPLSATSTASTTPFHACFVFPWDLPGPRMGPLMASSTGPMHIERNDVLTRSLLCTGVRPYTSLRALQ